MIKQVHHKEHHAINVIIEGVWNGCGIRREESADKSPITWTIGMFKLWPRDQMSFLHRFLQGLVFNGIFSGFRLR